MITIVTLDTVLTCQEVLSCTPSNVRCGVDVAVGNTLMYNYNALDGCSYSVYDNKGACIAECTFSSSPVNVMRGGGFTIDASMSYIKFSNNATLYKTVDLTVAEFIRGVTNVVAMRAKLAAYGIDEQHRQDIVDIYLDSTSSSTASTKFHAGAIYTSTLDVDPAELFGGIWRRLTDVFPASIFAWTYTGSSEATCGAFLCGEAICGH